MRSKISEELLTRIRGEYTEMPGLRLTADQCSRLWGVERDQCEELLHVLVDRGFLFEGVDGKYSRLSDASAAGHLRMARATLTGDRPAHASTPAGRRAGER
jgi:hypothetical protein